MIEIPQPAINRLCSMYHFLIDLETEGQGFISSAELGRMLGCGSHNIRKDIGYLGSTGNNGTGYEITKLREAIRARFGFNKEKRACIVGLGRIGMALLCNPQFSDKEIVFVAGFDSNINKLETIKTSVPVYPAYQIPEIVRKMNIELGIIAVPVAGAQEVTDRLESGGIRGILNFAPSFVKTRNEDIIVRNFDITGELRILSALVTVSNGKIDHKLTKE